MRVADSSVLFDVPFHDVFTINTPLGFRDLNWVLRTAPGNGRRSESRVTRGNSGRQSSSPREFIIPIQIERQDSDEEIIEDEKYRKGEVGRKIASRNENNNGVHCRTRSRRHALLGTGNPSKNGKVPLAEKDLQHQSKDEKKTICRPSDACSEPVCVDDSELELKDTASCSQIGSSRSQTQCPIIDLTDSSSYHNQGSSREKVIPRNKLVKDQKAISATPSYPVYTHLKSKLETDGRQIDYIQGDGNCFFRALSKSIYESEEFHDDVRQAVVDLIEKYFKDFEQFLDADTTIHDHIVSMRKNSTWASTAEIYAAATLLQRDIYVLSPDHTGDSYSWLLFSPRFQYNRDVSYHPCYLTLCHTHGNHYDRIAPLQGECNCDLPAPVLLGVAAYIDLTT